VKKYTFLTFFKSVAFFALITFSTSIHSQYYEGELGETDKESNSTSSATFKDRLYYGGNIGFNILANILFLEASPIVGYKISDNLSAGLGGKMMFVRYMQFKENYSIYGGSVFSRYRILDQFFLHAEFEVLNAYERQFTSPNYGQRASANMFFVGAGYSSGGGGLNLQAMLLYDLIDHHNSPYQGSYIFGNQGPPVILRVGFTVGF
jgi:hypothetical protein